MYLMFHTMKGGHYNLDEIYDMYPFEMEIFHALCVKDVKDRLEAKNSH